MFNVKSIAFGALKQAPSFLVTRTSSIIDGMIAGYFALLFFFSSSGYISTVVSLVVVALVMVIVGRVLDRVMAMTNKYLLSGGEGIHAAAASGSSASLMDEKEKLD